MLNFLEGITLLERYHQWAIQKLDKMRAKEGELKTQRLHSLESAIQGVSNQLDNLTRMRVRDLLTDEEYLAQRKELQLEHLKLSENLQRSQQAHGWLEPLAQLISFGNCLSILFKKGSHLVRRRILEIVGSNLFLIDKKVSICAKKPFSLFRNLTSFPQLSTLVEEVRTLQTNEPSFSETMEMIKRLMNDSTANSKIKGDQ
jgi:hypothetical protein